MISCDHLLGGPYMGATLLAILRQFGGHRPVNIYVDRKLLKQKGLRLWRGL